MSEAIARVDVDEGSAGNVLTMYDYYLKILYIAAKVLTIIKPFLFT